METRKITVISTKTQKRTTIMSSATTLGELKRDLVENNIDYNGMTFYEGISKIELKDDSSVLPMNVPYKGVTTNELVFMLTNSEKKIKSGRVISRSEAYDIIKRDNLQKKCLDMYGKNYTTCKTEDLIKLIESNSKPTIKKETTTKNVNTKTEIITPNSNCECENIKKVITTIICRLAEEEIISESEEKALYKALEGEEYISDKVESSYSKKELDNMFDFIN